MGSPYLSADESIVLSAHDIVINTISAEAILTNQRLMLVDRSHPRLLPQDIPFPAIETVTIGENSGDNPVLSLSIATPDGTRRPLAMVFPQGPRQKRSPERDEWAARVRELSLVSQHEKGVVPVELIPPWVPGPIPEDASVADDEEIVPPGTRFMGPSISERRSRAASASTKKTLGIAAVIIVIIALIGIAALFYAPPFSAGPVPDTTPVPTPEPTPVMTMPPTTTAVVTPEPTTSPAQPVSTIPQTGVWLRVQYDGAYTGTAGAPGRYRDVEGFGENFFQIAAKNELVTAAITKGDNSGNPLTVELYEDGALLKSATITKPGGTLNLDVILSPAETLVSTSELTTAGDS